MPQPFKLLIVAIGSLFIAAPAAAKPTMTKHIAPALVSALNGTQNLRRYPGQYYSTDFRVQAADIQRGHRLYRAPSRDKHGMQAYVFGVRVVTPHTKHIPGRADRVMATAVRRVVGVALVDKAGAAIIDASQLRVRRTDPPPQMYE